MNLIFRAARIVDPNGPYHGAVTDVLIQDGSIRNIGEKLANPDRLEEITRENLHVSPGWFDSSVSLGEPGFEDRENIANGLKIAALSGFTGIALQPNSHPVIDNQALVHFVKSKAQGATALYPIGALTKNAEGKDLAELFDMKNAGAIAFGDYNKSISNANLLKIGLQYVQHFDGLLIAFCQDAHLKGNGVANEGIVSTRLGLKGIPNLAEELIVARNLFLLQYTGGKMHIPTISTAGSVELVRKAKKKGLKVTCSASVHHLVLTDETLNGFDTRFKVIPPLRTETDRQALLEAVSDGTIDMITSDHNPIDIELKKMDFDSAQPGTIGLESAFGALMTVLPLDVIVKGLTFGREVFGIGNPHIAEGADANLTLFNPKSEWTFTKDRIGSKSKNAALLNAAMKGEVYGVYNRKKLQLR